MTDKKLVEKTKRITRKSLRNVGPLFIDPKYLRPGFVARWVNDKEGNLERFINLGYNPIQREVVVGDQRAATTHRLGSVVTASVGGNITAVLCEIPVDEHAEIQQEKKEMVRESEIAMKQTGIDSQYGEINVGK